MTPVEYEIDAEFVASDTEVDAEFGKFQYVGVPGPQGPAGPQGPQGQRGADGQPGKDGKTPVAGVDYYTPEEKQEFTESILANIPESGMQFDGGYVDDNGYLHLTYEGAEVSTDLFEPFYVGSDSSGGIHIGTAAPTDDTVAVWIDTDEEPEEPTAGKDGVGIVNITIKEV